MEYDLHHEQKGEIALQAALISTNTTTVGAIIDTKDFGGIEFFVFAGVVVNGAFNVLIEHGDDAGLSDAETVPAADLLGTPAEIDTTDDIRRVGYIGGTLADGTFAKRQFVRLSIVSTGVSTAAVIGALGNLGIPKHGPVADQ